MQQPLVMQPGFAPQLQRTLSSPLGVGANQLQRGYMIWARPLPGYTGGPLGDGRDILRFMFNPSTVSASYSVQVTGQQAAMNYQLPQDVTQLIPYPLQQTLTWRLFFDRSFELRYGKSTGTPNDPTVIGVQADVFQFMQFTGMTQLAPSTVSQVKHLTGGAKLYDTLLQSEVLGSLREGGIVQFVPAYVFFGNSAAQVGMNQRNNYNQANAIGSQLEYYGFITGWSVEYTHWTEYMVPIRCAVSVNFTLINNTNIKDTIAVWRDNQKLGLVPSTSPIPYTPGYGNNSPFPGISG